MFPCVAPASLCSQIARSTLYCRPVAVDPDDLALMRRIDELYLASPFYGSRRMVAVLRREGLVVNRKRVRRLMRLMGLEAIYQKPNTSQGHPDHKVYPYLLRGLSIERANQVWCADITYIPMARGFVYLVAVMDWFSRRVLSWRLSITMEADFCVEAVQEALAAHGRPEIFNTDQGVQFTSFRRSRRTRPWFTRCRTTRRSNSMAFATAPQSGSQIQPRPDWRAC